MAHEVESMFSVKETPWHGLGKIIKDAPKFEDILRLAGLDWTVSMQALYLGEKNGSSEVTQRAIMRDSDKSVLGFSGTRWEPIQNKDALNFFKPFYDKGAVKFETAGSLRLGQRIWFLAALNSDPIKIAKNDEVKKYLMFSNGHDGKMAIRIGFTPIRIVCANTLAMAHNNAESKLLRIFHSSKNQENLDKIQEIINLANQSFEATAEQYKKLVTIKNISKKDVQKYVDIVFYNGSQAESDREKIAREKINENILRLFETGHGNDAKDVRGTAWALYNGVTQYLSYEQGRDQDIRMDNLWFGAAKTTNEKALEAALIIKAA